MDNASAATLIALGALIVAAVGIIFTAMQIRRNTTVQRGMLFKDIYERFLTDPEFHYVFGLIEQSVPIFAAGYGTSDAKESKRRQAAVERLFAHLEVMCSLYRRGLFTDEDMREFNYAIRRVAQHPGFFDYQAFLADWAHRKQVERGPYDNVFRYVGTKLGLTPDSTSKSAAAS